MALGQQDQSPVYKDPKADIEARVADLLGRMTALERARQLDQYMGVEFVDKTHPRMETVAADGAKLLRDRLEREIGDAGAGCIHDLYAKPALYNEFQRYFVEETRLGIPALMSEEALHGLVRPGFTIFPQALSLAAAWNEDIARRIGRCIASEARSVGICETFGPVVDLAREPRWGRMEETYGEDTHLASRLAAAMVGGLQGESLAADDAIIAEPKHFAAHGNPLGGLNMAPCPIGKRELATDYLPVFEAAFREAGAINAMCSYNSIDGVPCAADESLLTDTLRAQWGMRGFVRADLGAVRRLLTEHCVAAAPKDAIRMALLAGVDMQYYDFPHDVYQRAIVEMAEDGSLPMAVLDRAVGRMLRVKFLLGLFDRPYVDAALHKRRVRCQAHIAAALDAARECICLLRNEGGLLPLSKNLRKIAVIGPGAAAPALGDYTPYIEGFEPVTVLEGIRAAVSGDTTVVYAKGVDFIDDTQSPPDEDGIQAGIAEAVRAAKGADAAVVVLGDSGKTCGEGVDRRELALPGRQLELLKAVHATGTSVALVLQNGRALALPWEAEHIPAILEAWYPGEQGGRAVAEALFGGVNPSGRLPVTFPRSVGALPCYYNRQRGGQSTYVEGENKPLFAFGHGLSYTAFCYAGLRLSSQAMPADGSIRAEFELTNAGRRAGRETAQLYVRDLLSSVVRPLMELKGFQKVALEAGETKTVAFTLRAADLWLIDREMRRSVEPGRFRLMIGSSAGAIELETEFEVI